MPHCLHVRARVRALPLAVAKILIVAALAACGESATKPNSPGTPPPVPTPVPASLVVLAGNDQNAMPGAAVGVKPVVVVRDDKGAPLAGIAVTFSADSGGGTIQSGSATTATDGSASPGTWTLGAGEGRNVLVARVGTLAPAKIVAVARVQPVVVNGGTVSAAGGALTLTLAGSPLNGTRLTLPPNAVSGSSQLSFTVSSAASIALPAGMTAIAPALSISGPSGALRSLALLRVPRVAAPGKIIALVAVASGTGELSVLPSVSQTASYITVGINSFDGSPFASTVNATPNASTNFGAAPANATAGGMVIVMTAIDASLIAKDFDSGFRPGVDDWDFPRQAISSFPESLGEGYIDAGQGMVATSLWYFSKAKPTNGNLTARYQEASGVHESNRKGLRWVSVTSQTMPDLYGPVGLAAEAAKNESGTEKEIADISLEQIKAAFLLSGNKPQPVYLLALDGNDDTPRHGIAFRTVGTTVELAFPDAPGKTIRMTLGSTGWTPITVTNFVNITFTIKAIYPVSYFAMVQESILAEQFARVKSGTIGDADGWPTKAAIRSKFGAHDTASFFALDSLPIWWECAVCADHGYRAPSLDVTPAPTRVQLFKRTFRDDGGAWTPFPPILTSALGSSWISATRLGSSSELTSGNVLYQPGRGSSANFAVRAAWLDWVTVRYRKLPVKITPDTVFALNDTTVTFTASATGAPAGSTYRFLYKGTAVDSTDKNTATYARPLNERRNAKVYATVLEPTTKRPIGRDSAVVKFATMWKFTSANLAQVTLPPGGIGSEKVDTAVQNILNSSIGTLTTAPAGGRINIVTAPTGCQYVVFTQPGPGPAADTGYVETAFRAILGANCPDPSFRQNLTLSNTVVTGEVTDLANNPDEINVPGGSITATRPSAKTLQGSFVWKARYSTGIATYRINFQASLVVPP